jgi:hypothetical protein
MMAKSLDTLPLSPFGSQHFEYKQIYFYNRGIAQYLVYAGIDKRRTERRVDPG